MNGGIFVENGVQLLRFHLLAEFHRQQLQRMNEKLGWLIGFGRFGGLHFQNGPCSTRRYVDEFSNDCVGGERCCLEFDGTSLGHIDNVRHHYGDGYLE